MSEWSNSCFWTQRSKSSDTGPVWKNAVTLMQTISSGMFIMAPVSQLSRFLAKFRMAWVKAPAEGWGWVVGVKQHILIYTSHFCKRFSLAGFYSHVSPPEMVCSICNINQEANNRWALLHCHILKGLCSRGTSVHVLGIGLSTSGMRASTSAWYSRLSHHLVHSSTGSNLHSSTSKDLGRQFSASSGLEGRQVRQVRQVALTYYIENKPWF